MLYKTACSKPCLTYINIKLTVQYTDFPITVEPLYNRHLGTKFFCLQYRCFQKESKCIEVNLLGPKS